MKMNSFRTWYLKNVGTEWISYLRMTWWHYDTEINPSIHIIIWSFQMHLVNMYMIQISYAHNIIRVFYIWCLCIVTKGYQCHPHGGLTTKQTQIYPLLALCEGNPPVSSRSHSQRQLCRKCFHVTMSSCNAVPSSGSSPLYLHISRIHLHIWHPFLRHGIVTLIMMNSHENACHIFGPLCIKLHHTEGQ